MRSHNTRGFSIIEMMIVIVVGLIGSAIAIMNVRPILQLAHANNAYNITLAAMRQAREQAIGTRRVYIVAFNNAVNPNKITITQGDNGALISTYTLPSDTAFLAQAGYPNPGPDTFGTGGTAIDFDQNVAGASAADKTSLYFYPDGSVQDINQNTNNGVIYIARSADLVTPRAITVWGATGRLRGWKLTPNGATRYWSQM
ncbi:MAG TPA: prepilin-type N-terminal cleavage/methylation domain-containing protein [Terriglobales bacterium]|nr:prepilin-type N-terminal cleavage/methylation domain-containing protein [Terriglobales bacterium]